MRYTLCFLISMILLGSTVAQDTSHTVAREWIEELLSAIRKDYARPTVHARNLWHHSIVIYDIWAVYSEKAETYFLGKEVDGFLCPFEGIPISTDLESDRHMAISYAAYRLLTSRFKNAPQATSTLVSAIERMQSYGYLLSNTSTDYASGDPAALGNYLAEQMILFGRQDGSNEQNDYANTQYKTINPPLAPELPGNQNILNPNRWQPLSLSVFIDQSGNPRPGGAPEFLSPYWGDVINFAIPAEQKTILTRDEIEYPVWHDPGAPPTLGFEDAEPYFSNEYKLGNAMVAMWSSHLDQKDGVLWDISPGASGNNNFYPEKYTDFLFYYKNFEGGDIGKGHPINPTTGQAYAPNIVPRGDFTRVLAEFWADGPDSETPPGHWYSITNYVNDHPDLVKKFQGKGDLLDNLEWDAKLYFALGGALHDAAISAWSIKGYYDYVRPISALRYMADLGQSGDQSLPNYHPNGILLFPGFIEVVNENDSLAGPNQEDVGKIKIRAWKGPDFIENPEEDQAGVDWILAENWWPYQRPTFITPPFAGFVSGHSVFSRAAAEVLTRFTGDAFFPGGIGEFVAKKDSFLVFEQGPSQDVILQWATYRDAADQTALSRIWGGIHPPADDLPGRAIGVKVGNDAFDKASEYFNNPTTSIDQKDNWAEISVYPNILNSGSDIHIRLKENELIKTVRLLNINGKNILFKKSNYPNVVFPTPDNLSGMHILQINTPKKTYIEKIIFL